MSETARQRFVSTICKLSTWQQLYTHIAMAQVLFPQAARIYPDVYFRLIVELIVADEGLG